MKSSERIKVCHTVSLPDPVKLARYERSPELGPRVLFFSGGTALKDFSRRLVRYTHNSIHIITPFDSGGSSAELRRAFNMIAVGDMRNRLMALSERLPGSDSAIFDLFAYRLPKNEPRDTLREELFALRDGKHPLIIAVDDPMRKLIRNHLRFFTECMPDTFDLRGASIGNLILAGGYFNYGRHIDPVIYLFSKLVDVKGTVRPVSSADLHLAAEMADGSCIVGQHLITGKETAPIASPVKRLFLTRDLEPEGTPEPCEVQIRSKVSDLIRKAELICYPMGSFYTSIIANLLPRGVGACISRNDCPKIYIPNSAPDPEQHGMSLSGCVRVLLDALMSSCDHECARDQLLNFMLVDTRRGEYPLPLDLPRIRRLGIEIIDTDLVDDDNPPFLSPKKVLAHLLSIV
ncbi:GAK system CofD-like protein [Oceanidesulfovibrio indonesiensis]|uniref:GAK system CofD-like protein n=1 Tax=Oceanidesulfovibrio indonesiensis TaxID=54767 RepID=A0A7M3MEP0_9BACT|nr:GAK system CofD-like protein [Oceanidesulfovibrio indonesiensis]TVM17365.1 GAK system CofD-like protein [Oceanidesulfovibrio indonesiensis]